MRKKLFNPKKYAPKCRNCAVGRISPDGNNVFCPKKGIKELGDCCRSYRYDPLKRVPKKAASFRNADPEEFKL